MEEELRGRGEEEMEMIGGTVEESDDLMTPDDSRPKGTVWFERI